MTKLAVGRSALFFVLPILSHVVFAQPCQPSWDVAIGNPGVADGYAGALGVWDDGGGEDLYVGGSFNSITGVAGTRLLARWDRSSDTWSSVGGGLSTGFTNGFLTSIVPFNTGTQTELVVGGFFFSAANVSGTKSLAKWNGTSWSALGSTFDPNSASAVWAMQPWNGVGGNRLYVGGSFPFAGEAQANGIAAWDGQTWFSLGSGIAGSFSPNVFELAVFDDGGGEQLYAGGRFDSMNGVASPLLARWDGTTWTRVGGATLTSASVFAGIETMVVFDDGNGAALYVGGNDIRAAGLVSSVAKWDGTAWSRVGQHIGGRVTSLIEFDDGTGPALYLGGTATPGVNYFARLEAGQWVAAAGGVGTGGSDFPSVFALGTWDNDLIVAGNFSLVDGQATAGLAIRHGCPVACPGDLNHDGVVSIHDLTILLSNFGTLSGATADDGDFDGDGDVGLDDLAAFLSTFGNICT